MNDSAIKLLVWFALTVGVLGIGAAGGWVAQGWRMSGQVQSKTAEIASLKAEHARIVADATDATNRKLINLINQRDAQTAALTKSNDAHLKQLEQKRHENEALQLRIDRGDVGLRVAATCPANNTGSAETGASSGVDTGTQPELDPAARPAYNALRQGIEAQAVQLSACQKELRIRTTLP